ncbi:hypothetical protein ACIRBX_14215 [Kitasatospora sp. NPDC096147]|uniref:hypothetical protein n=1 Tax=Kitasatospora sp. NPDC096147 TaxID=3364093 RepID=UPI003825C3A5
MPRSHLRSRRPAGAFLIPAAFTAVAVALAGCTTETRATARPEPVPTAVRDAIDLRLPVTAYTPTADERLRSRQAVQRVLQDCMKDFGLSFPSHDLRAPSGPVSATQMRYGVTSLAQAELTGYHFGAANPGWTATGPAPDPPDNTDPGYQLVLKGNGAPGTDGTPADHLGKPVPPGGCMGAMSRKLAAGATFRGEAALVKQISAEGFDRSLKDRAVVAAFAKWSACMADRGHHYATPMDALNDPAFAEAEPAPNERETAKADVACKAEHNVVGIWFAAEATFQRARIAEHQEELRTIRKQMDQQNSLAATVVATP